MVVFFLIAAATCSPSSISFLVTRLTVASCAQFCGAQRRHVTTPQGWHLRSAIGGMLILFGVYILIVELAASAAILHGRVVHSRRTIPT